MAVPSSPLVALLLSVGIVILGGAGFVAVADQDCRLEQTDTIVTVTDLDARAYDSLDAQEFEIFETARESEAYVAEEPFDFPDRVQRNDTYYEFQYSCFYDWTDPATVLPLLTSLGGLAGVVVSLRRR
jgi:hypothetical protein